MYYCFLDFLTVSVMFFLKPATEVRYSLYVPVLLQYSSPLLSKLTFFWNNMKLSDEAKKVYSIWNRGTLAVNLRNTLLFEEFIFNVEIGP